MNLEKSETLKILTRAFAGECEDGAKYQFLADMATQNQLDQVSTILKGLATNEMAHAKIFYDYIGEKISGGVKSVEIHADYPMQYGEFVEMLKFTADNENMQEKNVYPKFAKLCKEEGFDDIAQKFEQIAKIEHNHAEILIELYNRLKNNTLYSFNEEKLVKCTNCGHEEKTKSVWKTCPLCKKAQGFAKLNLDKCSCGCN